MDIFQKRALTAKPLYPTILAARFTVFALTTLLAVAGTLLGFGAPWSAAEFHLVLHTPHFFPMMLLDCALLAASTVLYYRALQIAPLSLTIPFLTFTPAFLLLTSHVVLEERLSLVQVEGVAVVVFGSLLMYRSQFKVSWWEPLRALGREPGSRYMLMAALIMSLTNSLEKWLVVRSSMFTYAWYYALGSCILMSGIVLFHMLRTPEGFRYLAWGSIFFAGFADTTTLALQFAALLYLPAVVTIGIKRSGIILTVLAGWIFFRERQIANRLAAAAVMVCGAIMLSFSFTRIMQTTLMVTMAGLGWLGPRLVDRLRNRDVSAAS